MMLCILFISVIKILVDCNEVLRLDICDCDEYQVYDYTLYKQYYVYRRIPRDGRLELYEASYLIWTNGIDDKECGIILSDVDYTGISLIQIIMSGDDNELRNIYYEKINNKWINIDNIRYRYKFILSSTRMKKIIIDINLLKNDNNMVIEYNNNNYYKFIPQDNKFIIDIKDNNQLLYKININQQEKCEYINCYYINNKLYKLNIKISSPYYIFTINCLKNLNTWICDDPTYHYVFIGNGFVPYNLTLVILIFIFTI